MTETVKNRLAEIKARQPAMKEAHFLANRDALLEHARTGRSVYESRDGQIVEVSPAGVFARYGFDEISRPRPSRMPACNRS